MGSVDGKTYRVVVGFDFTELGYMALHGAINTAVATQGAELHVLGVIDSRSGLGPVDSGAVTAISEVHKRIDSITRRALARRGAKEVSYHTHARISGAPALAIVELANEQDAECIVVGTHGRHGVDRLLHGSVAEHIVRDADCPVLVMRRKVEHNPDDEFQPEPPCPACEQHRHETNGAEMWCEAHDHPAPYGRTYGRSLAVGSAVHDWRKYNP